MTQIRRGADVYRRTEAVSRSPLELVVMLYDGALRFLTEAREGADRGDRLARRRGVSKALAIVGELQSTLNLDKGGQVAEQLDTVYIYITGRLLDSTVKRDDAAIDEARRLLSTLRDGWAQIASQSALAGTP